MRLLRLLAASIFVGGAALAASATPIVSRTTHFL
jgi:hypothetical protein